ncbi:MAG: cyclic lactone autoinducer peptide [Peptococcaceae bacterium]|nr:cyclic lactone autoinducer peptide [Peptococcaceae bacterium]MDH7524478.1 cyclic lactone autoinducer peptide [Peptococcaceae bacterium]
MKRLDNLVKRIAPVVCSLVMLAAVYGGAKAASIWGFYQPRTPKCLR